jgi:4-amino-4-deoxy-L-arabinose transferase-like glycosyltransferase
MTDTPQAAGVPGAPAPAPVANWRWAIPAGRLSPALGPLRHLPLAGLLALSAVLNVQRLSRNGYANIFYAAGVKSMLRSLHNFLFVSFDPGGLITIDKPPLALWLQVASAKLFGFSPLSLLLPEAIAGVLSVAALYVILTRRLGPLAGLAGGLGLAVFPSFVAVSRDNGVDPLLLLLLILACGAALWAIRAGRLGPLLLCSVLIGLAFNTKTLAAYLVVPGIALPYLLCAPRPPRRLILHLLAAGIVLAIVSGSWIAVVELTPASQRPFVGSSTDNTELGLTFEYNGVGRVGGQVGGPGRVPVGTGALVSETPARRPAPAAHVTSGRGARAKPRPHVQAGGGHEGHGTRARTSPSADRHSLKGGLFSELLPDGREVNPIAFGGGTGPLRLFGSHLGDQGSWILPFALLSLLAVPLTMIGRRRCTGGPAADAPAPASTGSAGPESKRGGAGQASFRDDPRLAPALVFGGWLLVEVLVLSFSKGIVHPYYISALAPGAGALAGIGVALFIELARRRPRDPRVLLLVPAVAATVLAQVIVLYREHYMRWFVPILIVGAVIGTVAILGLRRISAVAMSATFCLLLVAPAGYATTTWLAPVEGTFPAAGPKQATGVGGVGIDGESLRVDEALIAYVTHHSPGSRWIVLTDASESAAPFILLGYRAGAMAGYSGTDPALDGPGLARLVARREARYVALGGLYSARGGNRATSAVLHSCRQLPRSVWGGGPSHYEALVLFDCAGRERRLESDGP